MKGLKYWFFLSLTLLLFLSAYLIVYYQGSLAISAVSPGPLNKAHRILDKKDNNCRACHKPWQGVEEEKCKSCHKKTVYSPQSAQFHRLLNENKTLGCLSCHTEHKGANGSVVKKGAELHVSFLPEELSNCTACHVKEKELHLRVKRNPYNGRCNQCHTTLNWQMTTFSHQLLKDSALRDCQGCHKQNADIHKGNLKFFSHSCPMCHNTKSWKPSQSNLSQLVNPLQPCASCHAKTVKSQHIEKYGRDCEVCHTPLGWSQIKFNHENLPANNCRSCHSNPPLNNHQNLTMDCSNCHIKAGWYPAVFTHEKLNESTLKACINCHRDVSAHRADFGQQCWKCHDTQSWLKNSFNHTQSTKECSNCHQASAKDFHQDLKPVCKQCHKPGNWQVAVFKHEIIKTTSIGADCWRCHSADFQKHIPDYLRRLNCLKCHSLNKWIPADFQHEKTQEACVSCHYPPPDAYHQNVSNNCRLCHSTTKWSPALAM